MYSKDVTLFKDGPLILGCLFDNCMLRMGAYLGGNAYLRVGSYLIMGAYL